MLRLMMALALLLLSNLAWIPDLSAQVAEGLPTEESVRSAFDRGNPGEAGRAIDRLIEARLRQNTPPRPDPLLDRLVGEALVPGNPQLARIFSEPRARNSDCDRSAALSFASW